MKPGLRGTHSPHTVESVMKLKSHDSQYRSSPPELLAFHTLPPKRWVKVPTAKLLGQGQRHLILVIDGVSQEGDQLAPGALNLKNIDI